MARPMEEGASHLDGFFYFFVRRCLWSTPGNVKTTAASIKKFYRCMAAKGHISQEDYELISHTIKEGLPIWQEDCAAYNSGCVFGW